MQERETKSGSLYFRNSLSTQKPQILDNLSQDGLGFTHQADFSFHPFSHGLPVCPSVPAMKGLSFWRGQSVSSPVRHAQLVQTQSDSAPSVPLWLWAGNGRNTPLHLCPRELVSFGGETLSLNFAKKSNLLLWVTYVPCSAGTQGDGYQGWRRSPPQAQPGCTGLLRPRRRAGDTAASALSLIKVWRGGDEHTRTECVKSCTRHRSSFTLSSPVASAFS